MPEATPSTRPNGGGPGRSPLAPTEIDADAQALMLAALMAELQARDGRVPLRLDTHLSVVLVHGGQAWKFKKPLAGAFVDQSTLARRQQACADEVQLNRRYAPSIYLGVAHVTGTPQAPELQGRGPLLDVAVHMRAFDNAGLWAAMAARGTLGPAQIDDLAATLARFHDAAPRAGAGSAHGTPARVAGLVQHNLDELSALATSPGGRGGVRRLRQACNAALARLAPVLAQRHVSGAVRELHGDLHLGNVVQVDGRATPFDGIEFNADWRWVDSADELAFLAMDLRAHGLPGLAHRFVNACLEWRGDYAAAEVLPLYAAYRAAVRAKVSLLRAAQPDADGATQRHWARRYLALALACARVAARPPPAALLLTHGPSGSGKTTLTQPLLEALGALRIRSDVERKRLAGLPALAASGSVPGAGLYGAEMTRATYARLLEAAAPVLSAGCPAILDATFLQREHRAQARAWAAEHGHAVWLLDFDVPADRMRQRLRQRAAQGGDASEATAAVLDAQLRDAQPLQAEERRITFPVPPTAPEAPAAWEGLLQHLRQPNKNPQAVPDGLRVG